MFDETEHATLLASSDGPAETSGAEDAQQAAEEDAIWSEVVAASGETPPDDEPEDAPHAPAAPAQTQQAPADIWADAPDALREQYNALLTRAAEAEHRSASAEGRYQAALRDLEQVKAGNSPNDDDDPDPEEPGQDDWSLFTEEYPEVAAPIEKQLQALQDNIARLSQGMEVVGQRYVDEALDAEGQKVLDEHPDYEAIIGRPDFTEWLGQQHENVQAMAANNWKFVQDAGQVSAVVRLFKGDKGIASANGGGGAPRPTQNPVRDMQRRTSTGGPAPSGGAVLPMDRASDDDEDAIWKEVERDLASGA